MGMVNKRRRAWPGATLVALLLLTTAASAQDLLVRGATVATASARGNVEDADVLVQGGIIRTVGRGLSAPAGVPVVEAKGRMLTPALFGGITEIGIEEVSGESSTVDAAVTLQDQPMRPLRTSTSVFSSVPRVVAVCTFALRTSRSCASAVPDRASAHAATSARIIGVFITVFIAHPRALRDRRPCLPCRRRPSAS